MTYKFMSNKEGNAFLLEEFNVWGPYSSRQFQFIQLRILEQVVLGSTAGSTLLLSGSTLPFGTEYSYCMYETSTGVRLWHESEDGLDSFWVSISHDYKNLAVQKFLNDPNNLVA